MANMRHGQKPSKAPQQDGLGCPAGSTGTPQHGRPQRFGRLAQATVRQPDDDTRHRRHARIACGVCTSCNQECHSSDEQPPGTMRSTFSVYLQEQKCHRRRQAASGWPAIVGQRADVESVVR